MVAQADREVVFRLAAEVAQDAQQAFNRFAAMGDDANERIAAGAQAAAQLAAESWGKAFQQAKLPQTASRLSLPAPDTSATEKAYEAVRQQQEKTNGNGKAMAESLAQAETSAAEKRVNGQSKAYDTISKAAEKRAQQEVRTYEQAAKEAEKQRAREEAAAWKSYDKQQKEAEKAAATESKAMERAAKEAERARQREEKAAERARIAAEKEADRKFKAEVVALERTAKEEKKRWAAEEKNREKAVEADRKAREKQQRDEEKAIRAAEQAQQQALARTEAAARGMQEAYARVTEGAMKMGRGIAILGIAGEEDLQKWMKSLAKIQAVFDLTRGGIELYRGLSDAVKAYRAWVVSATVAEEALALARAKNAAIPPVRPGIGGVGLGGTIGLGAAMVGVAGYTAYRAARESRNPAEAYGFDEQTRMPKEGFFGPNTTAGWALSTGYGYGTGVSGVELRERALQAAEKTKRMEEERDRQREESAAAAERIRNEATARARGEQAARGLDLLAIDRRADERGLKGAEADAYRARSVQGRDIAALDQARAEAAELERRQAEFRGTGRIDGRVADSKAAKELEAQIAAARERQSVAEQQAVESSKQRLAAEQAITQEKMRGADELIAKGREEIAMREAAIEREKQAKMTAADRIAAMTAEEQSQFEQQITAIREKQAAGETLTAEEYRFAQSWSGVREVASIRDEQRERRSAGVLGRTGLLDREDEEIRRIERGQTGDQTREFAGRTMAEVEARIKQQTEVKVKLEMDRTALVRDITEQIREQQSQQYRRIMEDVQRELDPIRMELDEIDMRNASGSAAARG